MNEMKEANNHSFVGAADGIYQYHVNVAARRMFPSIVMR